MGYKISLTLLLFISMGHESSAGCLDTELETFENPILFKTVGKHLCRHDPKNLPIGPSWLQSRQACSNRGIITSAHPHGRFGNILHRYAEVLAISASTNLTGYIPECMLRKLRTMFRILSLQHNNAIWDCLYIKINYGTLVQKNNEKIATNFYNNKLVVISWKSNEWSIRPFISQQIKFIRKELQLREKFIDYAQNALHKLVWKFRRKFNSSSDTLRFIGIHVRRTDYKTVTHKDFEFGHFNTAMDYFEQKYPQVIFVVLSDDPTYCRFAFSHKTNAFVVSLLNGETGALNDFAIMTQCNDSIIDFGTFGLWGALLAGGETLVPNQNFFGIYDPVLKDIDGAMPNWKVVPTD